MMKTVVLLGDVGVGKSTIVEKCTGARGLSSAADESFTRQAHPVVSACGALKCIDVPGANAMAEPLVHNVWIAHAFNCDPVSRILLTVKADTRIDNTVDAVGKYVDRFEDFIELMTVCVTHMDTVQWTEQRFLQCIDHALGINNVLFVGISTAGELLKQAILQQCGPPCNLTIDSSNFLKYFSIHDHNFRILRTVRDEVLCTLPASLPFFSFHGTHTLFLGRVPSKLSHGPMPSALPPPPPPVSILAPAFI